MELGHLADRLDELLDVEAYQGHDPSLNGLQLGDESTEVEQAVGAVDIAIESIERAIGLDADILVVHHGLFWGDQAPLTGHRFDRIERLTTHDIAVYAAHLPLDGHQDLGHAAVIGSRLGLTDISPFPSPETPVGIVGATTADFDELVSEFAATLAIEETDIATLGSDPDDIDRVAIVTGRGTDFIEAAANAGADVLITGEAKHEAYHEAAELDVQVLLGGHYETETVGIRQLLGEIEEWDIETTFVDIPTGL